MGCVKFGNYRKIKTRKNSLPQKSVSGRNFLARNKLHMTKKFRGR